MSDLLERDWEGDFYKLLGDQMANDPAFRALVSVAAEVITRVDGHVEADAPDWAQQDEDEEADEYGPVEDYEEVRFSVAPAKLAELRSARDHVNHHQCDEGAHIITQFALYVLAIALDDE